MDGWGRRLRGAIGMGVTWAVGWGLVGGGIELIHNIWPNPLGSLVDIWPAMLAIPGFFGGLVFSTVLGIAGRHRRFDELSLFRFAAWGALAGLLLGLTFAGAMGLRGAVALVGAVTLLSTASATALLSLARMAEDGDGPRELPRSADRP